MIFNFFYYFLVNFFYGYPPLTDTDKHKLTQKHSTLTSLLFFRRTLHSEQALSPRYCCFFFVDNDNFCVVVVGIITYGHTHAHHLDIGRSRVLYRRFSDDELPQQRTLGTFSQNNTRRRRRTVINWRSQFEFPLSQLDVDGGNRVCLIRSPTTSFLSLLCFGLVGLIFSAP